MMNTRVPDEIDMQQRTQIVSVRGFGAPCFETRRVQCPYSILIELSSAQIAKTMDFDDVFARVVGGRHKAKIAVKFVVQPCEIANSARYVLLYIASILDAEPLGCLWHQLHKPHRALHGNRTSVPSRFLFDHGADK